METTATHEERGGVGPATPALRQMQSEEDTSIKEWLDALGGDSAIKVTIARTWPKTDARGKNIAGQLETVDEKIDEDYIRENWGGGKYQLKVLRPNKAGQFTYLKARSVHIGGEPRMRGEDTDAMPLAAAGGGDGDLARSAFSILERASSADRNRADRLEQELRRSGGLDTAALEVVLAPLREQLRAALEEARDLRVQLIQQSNKAPPTDPFRDALLQNMLQKADSTADAIRTQYEVRIEKIRDAHEEQIKRLDDRHRDDIRRMEDAHKRELHALEKGVDTRTDGQKLAYEARIDALKDEKARLERELNALQTRLGALEARKDQSLTEKAQELMTVREALEGLGGGAGGDEAPWYQKVIDGIGNSEATLALINRIGGGGAAEGGANAAAPGQQQLPPPGQPFKGPDGQIYVVGPDGQPRLVPPAAIRQQRLLAQRRRRQLAAQRGAGAAPAETAATEDGQAAQAGDLGGDVVDEAIAAAAPPQAPVRPPDPAEVKLAIQFMEAAIQRGADPVDFARSASSLIPADILRFIQRIGVDRFLGEVVRPEPGTPLATQRGRNFVRQVAKVLLEGAPE